MYFLLNSPLLLLFHAHAHTHHIISHHITSHHITSHHITQHDGPVVSCPAGASGAPSCSCSTGYSGTLTWDATNRVYLGSCPGLTRTLTRCKRGGGVAQCSEKLTHTHTCSLLIFCGSGGVPEQRGGGAVVHLQCRVQQHAGVGGGIADVHGRLHW